MADSFSGWISAKIMKNTKASSTIGTLRSWFSDFGLPKIVVTDQGSQFESEEFAQFMRENGIQHIDAPSYHQQSNGLAERGVQTLKKALKSNRVTTANMQITLYNFLLAHRSTPCTTRGRTPSEMFMNRRLSTRLDLLKPSQHRININLRFGVDEPKFSAGEKVFVRNFRGTPKWISGEITRCVSETCFEIFMQGRTVKRHVDHILRNHTESRSDILDDDWDLCDEQENANMHEIAPRAVPAVVNAEPPVRRYPPRVRRSPDRFIPGI